MPDFILAAKIGQISPDIAYFTKKILTAYYEIMEKNILNFIGEEPYNLLKAVLIHYPKLEGFMLQGEDPEQSGIPENVKEILVSLQKAKEELFHKTAKTYENWMEHLQNSIGRFEAEIRKGFLAAIQEKLGA